ncbi:MAG: AAA family ATPase [Caldilineaceae bacterium]|nr:AAA family ATPase [Caldilineaceae bacterium]
MATGEAASAILSIHTFGQVAATIGTNGQPLPFETRTVQALFLYLACQRRPIGRDQLAELLWPDRSQEQGRANLRVAIHRLRRDFAPYLLITRQTLAFQHDAPIALDVTRFENAFAADDLAAATALYQGDFLAGFYLDESSEFEQWMLLERERLHILALTAFQQWITQLVESNQSDAAIRVAQRLLQLDPFHEPTHRQLMRLLTQTGQHSAALAQYESCRRLLASELGVTPDETTTALAEQIRTGTMDRETKGQRDKGKGEEGDRPSPPLPFSLSALPPQPTPFIGREVELAQIGQLLSNPDCRLLTLLGGGGVGKTRLAIEAARRLHQSAPSPIPNLQSPVPIPPFPGGICFVSLAPVGTIELLLVAIAHRLGMETTSQDLLAQVSAYLHPRKILLVLDNFEHLLDAAETVAHLLHRAPQCKALVTSRQRLQLLEEWLLPIAGLGLAGGAASEAGELFLRSARRLHTGFRSDGQEEAIAAICRQAEGMPLAIELAASWVRVMSCEEISRQMGQSLEILTTTARNLPERHRSLYALFDHSWRLLSAEEQRVLRGASVFQGGWTLDDAAHVLAADESFGPALANGATSIGSPALHHLLLALVDKSLVQIVEQRFRMHELVRQYAAQKLAASGEEELIRQRHYNAYLHLARTADAKVRGPEVVAWFARLEAEQDNLRAAWQWTLTTQRFVDAAWLGIALCHTWHIRARWYEVAQWLEQLLPHRHLLTPDLRLALLLTLYRFWIALQHFWPIEAYANELNQLEKASQEPLLRATVWFYIANSTPDVTQAGRCFDLCIHLLLEAGGLPGLGLEYCFFADRVNLLAMAYFRHAIRLTDETGEYARAEALATQSLHIFQGMGNRDMIAYPLGILGHLALLRGEWRQAHRLLGEAVRLAQAVGNRISLGDWQPKLGIAAFYLGDRAAARRILNESLQLWLDLKNDVFLARIYGYLAEIELAEGNFTEAARAVRESLGYQVKLRWLSTEVVDCLWVAARLAVAQNHYVQAATFFGLAEAVRLRVHYPAQGPYSEWVDAALAIVQAALGPVVFAEAFAAGQQMSLEGAFATSAENR